MWTFGNIFYRKSKFKNNFEDVMYVALLKQSKEYFRNLEMFGGADKIFGGVGRKSETQAYNDDLRKKKL